jgi:hypothetical protein
MKAAQRSCVTLERGAQQAGLVSTLASDTSGGLERVSPAPDHVCGGLLARWRPDGLFGPVAEMREDGWGRDLVAFEHRKRVGWGRRLRDRRPAGDHRRVVADDVAQQHCHHRRRLALCSESTALDGRQRTSDPVELRDRRSGIQQASGGVYQVCQRQLGGRGRQQRRAATGEHRQHERRFVSVGGKLPNPCGPGHRPGAGCGMLADVGSYRLDRRRWR